MIKEATLKFCWNPTIQLRMSKGEIFRHHTCLSSIGLLNRRAPFIHSALESWQICRLSVSAFLKHFVYACGFHLVQQSLLRKKHSTETWEPLKPVWCAFSSHIFDCWSAWHHQQILDRFMSYCEVFASMKLAYDFRISAFSSSQSKWSSSPFAIALQAIENDLPATVAVTPADVSAETAETSADSSVAAASESVRTRYCF